MNKFSLHIIPVDLLEAYKKQVSKSLASDFEKLHDAELSTSTFNFYTSIAVISSSRIEGEPMEVDSYVKHKMLNIEYRPELVEKPNDLYKAYLFAQKSKLTKIDFLKSHALLSTHLLPRLWQGKYRKNEMVVMEHKKNKIQYEAAPYSMVNREMNKLWKDIEILKNEKLSIGEVFYFASFIHILFVNIHPFNDGNGRAARLLEKWFLAEKLGEKAWYLPSESYYYKHVNTYYSNLNRLGIFYDSLDYTKAEKFLLMLPEAIKG